MSRYYVNPEVDDGTDHEVHKEGCNWMPAKKEYLGDFDNCHQALNKAREKYRNVDGCFHCSRECHKE
jgi:hypothetical protein